jgi:hypothetical protein
MLKVDVIQQLFDEIKYGEGGEILVTPRSMVVEVSQEAIP